MAKTQGQKIISSLWFDSNCEEAMNFYVSLFPDSKITNIHYYPEDAKDPHLRGMSGKVLHGEFVLAGHKFSALDGGPVFTFNPSKSFLFTCQAKEEQNSLWQKLSAGGKVLMPLDKYPFSDYYGWVQDKYGLSWQLILNKPEGDWRPKIVPSIMFIHDNAGQAEAARDFYLSVFPDSQAGMTAYYEPGTAPDEASRVAFLDFQLLGSWFAAMDAGRDIHDYELNEAISFTIDCEDQAEVDYYWNKLSAVPEAEQCGWLRDKYSVSWQVVPKRLGELMNNPDKARATRALDALMSMKKIDIAALEVAAG